MEHAHQRLAYCLYYVLTGVDMDSQIRSMTSAEDLETFRKTVRQGDYPLDLEASAFSDLIKDAWMKKSGSTSFIWISKVVGAALEGLDIEQESELPPVLTQNHYRSLHAKCRE
ncbi:hypothetical protein C7999DRAFT_35455 [Corynascus novoguineensis]|uniref:Uncharacterized protein n=1 Tax=Corynascus novoguineensis TaxID=1126955 RepID=A0AAN7HG74_9PEZI|nr:hypothetical protein C7999DRAFT_35455 [Corynascus novoguineensis]